MKPSNMIPPPAELHCMIEAEPFAVNLGAFLDEAVARHGDKTAFTFFEEPETAPDRSLTYRQLDKRVRRLASGLHKLGVRKGQHVGVMLPNVPACPLTWLALARLGAVMVPINVRYTARELSYVLNDSDAMWLIVQGKCLPILDEVGEGLLDDGRIIVTNGSAKGDRRAWLDVMESGDESFSPPEEPAVNDLVTIQYTSGTTGFPKGVMLSHLYWLVFAKNGTLETRYLGIERMLLCQPFYYMAGQGWFLFGLLLGAQLFMAPQLSINRFMPWVRQTRAQYSLATNAILKQQLPPEDRVNELKFIHVGAAYTHEAHAEIERQFGCIVRNSYGMTENGIAIYVPINAQDKVGPDSIGVPTPHREAMIADAEGKPLPDGEIGEICVRGPGILHGYYKKPDANKASFFGEWHRSGDRAYRDKDGYYHFLGRMKDVIRRNNENISALEIETVLLGFPGILRAAAVAVPDDKRGEEVKACVMLNPGLSREQVTPDAIVSHCTRNLAAFKIPRYIEYRAEMPTTSSGKVEKHSLIKGIADLRLGAYDREDKIWR